jgi:hypothetical protein
VGGEATSEPDGDEARAPGIAQGTRPARGTLVRERQRWRPQGGVWGRTINFNALITGVREPALASTALLDVNSLALIA